MVIPKVGSKAQDLEEKYIKPAKEMGYQVYIHFVDIPKEKALGRLLNRLI